MARAWITLPRIGTGTGADPFRPNLVGVAYTGFCAALYTATQALVLVSGPPAAITAAKAIVGAVTQADEQADGRLLTAGRTALRAEVTRLGAVGATFQEGGYRV